MLISQFAKRPRKVHRRDSWESLMDEFSWWSKQIAKKDHHQHFCLIARGRFHFGGNSNFDLFVAVICHHPHNLPPSMVLNMLSSPPSFISPVLPWPVPTLLQCSIFVLFSPISCCWKSWHHKRGNLCRPRSSSITWAIADQINIIQRYSTICPTPSQWQIFQGKIVNIAKCCTFFYPSLPLLIIQNKTESPPAHLSQNSTKTFVENSDFCCWFQIISSSDGAPSLMRDQICPPPEFGYSQTRKSFENPSLKRLTLKSVSRWKTYNVDSQCMLKKVLKYWRY